MLKIFILHFQSIKLEESLCTVSNQQHSLTEYSFCLYIFNLPQSHFTFLNTVSLSSFPSPRSILLVPSEANQYLLSQFLTVLSVYSFLYQIWIHLSSTNINQTFSYIIHINITHKPLKPTLPSGVICEKMFWKSLETVYFQLKLSVFQKQFFSKTEIVTWRNRTI